jgi:hypothetical protein
VSFTEPTAVYSAFFFATSATAPVYQRFDWTSDALLLLLVAFGSLSLYKSEYYSTRTRVPFFWVQAYGHFYKTWKVPSAAVRPIVLVAVGVPLSGYILLTIGQQTLSLIFLYFWLAFIAAVLILYRLFSTRTVLRFSQDYC